MNNVLQIFGYVAEMERLKIGSLEKSIGASKGVLSRAIKNGSDVQSKWFLALVENYPQYNYEKMLKGDFDSRSPRTINEPPIDYTSQDLLLTVRDDIKNDLKEMTSGFMQNFETLSNGVVETLRGQQKILRFINKLNAEDIAKAGNKLNEFLEEHK